MDAIDRWFGALIREAYLDLDLAEYIDRVRNQGESKGLEHFSSIGKALIDRPEHAIHVKKWENHYCRQRAAEAVNDHRGQPSTDRREQAEKIDSNQNID